MTREPILLVGTGGHSRACIDEIEQEGRFGIDNIKKLDLLDRSSLESSINFKLGAKTF